MARPFNRLTVYLARDGWRWHLKAGNGKVIAESAGAYRQKARCEEAARRVMNDPTQIMVLDRDGKPVMIGSIR